jgi:hypothetical protein
MAVDSRHQDKGIGGAMLKHFMTKAIEVSEKVGVRLVLVHAMDEQAKDSIVITASSSHRSTRLP